MKDLVIQASEILEDKFKIKPEKSSLYIYEDIKELLAKTRNPQALSIFFPKDISAHVPKGRLDLIFHEYHGHGLYCEHTGYGKKMVEDEKIVTQMSKEDIKKALQMHEFFKLYFEGHALWTEEFLLNKLGKEDLFKIRLKELENLTFSSAYHPELKTQKDVYTEAKKFEQEKGIYDFWYTLGFPRQFDKKTLLEIAKEKLNSRFDKLVFLIHFGSKNKEGDIDLCAILEDGVNLEEYLHSRTIDLSQFNYKDAINKIKLFEIPLIQPILTGELIFGDENNFQKLKTEIKTAKPSTKAIKYLQGRSQWCFDYAIKFAELFDSYPHAPEIVLNNLAYALSFFESAKRYKNGSKVLTLNELNNPLLIKIRNYTKDIEKKNIPVEKQAINYYIGEVKKEINP
ncbi:MAG: hypothetical protein WC413_01215 [Candidatus Nanoarchaeia archaeon]